MATIAFTVEKHDPPHDDFEALSEDYKKAILSRVKFLGWKKVAMRFKPFLEVFQLNKLLIPGVQTQIQMYFNSPDIWSMVYGEARSVRLTEPDVKVRVF